MSELVLRRPPEPANRSALMKLEVVRATQILYAIDARDLVIPFVADLADRAVDPGALVVIAEIAKKHDDARAMLMIGKAALNRGYAFDVYAFPTNGIPEFRMVGPRSTAAWSTPSPGRKARSTRAPSPAPRPTG